MKTFGLQERPNVLELSGPDTLLHPLFRQPLDRTPFDSDPASPVRSSERLSACILSGILAARNSPISISHKAGIGIGHLGDFLSAMWLVSQGEVTGPRRQIGNMGCIGLPVKRTSLHLDARGSYIPGFLAGVKLGRQRQQAIREAWICT
jgi:hypothetical protein